MKIIVLNFLFGISHKKKVKRELSFKLKKDNNIAPLTVFHVLFNKNFLFTILVQTTVACNNIIDKKKSL